MSDVVLEGPLEGQPFQILGGFDLAACGYVGEEYFVSGSARSYTLEGERRPDGRWQTREDVRADYKTRFLVRRPADPARFNGTLVLEWMNVTGGLDAAPDWLFLHTHLMREGAAWVGVSAQKVGIDGGGMVPGMPLKSADEARYGSLRHPGDAFSFDIFTQVGQLLRAGEFGVFEPGSIERVIAVGESQSAGFLATYVNAIDPIAREFDAFIIHGRPGMVAELDGEYLRPNDDEDLSDVPERFRSGDRVRQDLRVPVLVLVSETDIVTLGAGFARQPDGDLFRLWEVAGAAHFDTYGLLVSMQDDGRLPIERLAKSMLATDKPMGMQASSPINSGPQQRYILNAAFAAIERQVIDGTRPPRAPRLETLTPDGREFILDENGIATGGIRSPWVDAPTAVLSGLGQEGEVFAFLFGTTVVFDDDTLARLYPGGSEEHLARFDAATDAAVKAGFILEADVEQIRALGRYGAQPSGWQHG